MNAKRRRTLSVPEWRKYMRFWGRDVERDIDDEVRFHLEMCERDLIAAGIGHLSRGEHVETAQRHRVLGRDPVVDVVL